MKILIDNGHGENTPGKRSPDGSLREYAIRRQRQMCIRDSKRSLRTIWNGQCSSCFYPLQCCRKRCRMDERKRMERLYIERQDKG